MKLEVKQLSKSYGKQQALNSISITFTEGVYGLLGPNGSGKTTFLNVLIGILESDQGTIFLNGEEVNLLGKKYMAQIGYMPQYPIFYKNFSVIEFMKYMSLLKNVPKKEKMARIQQILSDVNLTEHADKKIRALSGGMRQRLGIAQALLNDPKILVLDEPTAGLDPGERVRFRNIITKFSKNRIVLIATHIVSDVSSIADKIVMLRKGEIVLCGTQQELEERAAGKAWEMTLSSDLLNEFLSKYLVSNLKNDGASFKLKILNDTVPANYKATQVAPTLEDVFLLTFEGQEHL